MKEDNFKDIILTKGIDVEATLTNVIEAIPIGGVLEAIPINALEVIPIETGDLDNKIEDHTVEGVQSLPESQIKDQWATPLEIIVTGQEATPGVKEEPH